MQKQPGACAFSAACVMPGPRIAIEGTNLRCCSMHARLMREAEPSVAEAARVEFRPPRGSRRRNGWVFAPLEAY